MLYTTIFAATYPLFVVLNAAHTARGGLALASISIAN